MAWHTPWVLQNAHRYPDDHDGHRLYRHYVQVGRDGCTIMDGDVCIVFPSMLLVEVDYFHGFKPYAAGGPVCQTAESEDDYLALELVGVARKVEKKRWSCAHTSPVGEPLRPSVAARLEGSALPSEGGSLW